MYADRYTGGRRFNPGGLAAAVGINAAVVGALMFAGVQVAGTPDEPPITIIDIPVTPPPEPKKSEPRPLEKTSSTQPVVVDPIVEVTQPLNPDPIGTTEVITPVTPGPLVGTSAGPGTGEGVVVDPPVPPAPMLVGPALDPRYARELQPPYPPSEQREGNDGRVTVRVRIGADGRVKEVQRVSATSDAFFRATEEQARRRWRFRPATRDGVAEEAWKTMAVTFVLQD